MSSILLVFIVSMLPIAELRGGLPLGLSLGLSPAVAYTVSIAGNLLPVLPLLLLLRYGMGLARRCRWSSRVLDNWQSRVRNKQDMVSRYGLWGIVLLVAIPLPVTGAWTGALVSVLLSLHVRRAFFAICAGVCLAGLIVLSATIGIISVGRILGGM